MTGYMARWATALALLVGLTATEATSQTRPTGPNEELSANVVGKRLKNTVPSGFHRLAPKHVRSVTAANPGTHFEDWVGSNPMRRGGCLASAMTKAGYVPWVNAVPYTATIMAGNWKAMSGARVPQGTPGWAHECRWRDPSSDGSRQRECRPAAIDQCCNTQYDCSPEWVLDTIIMGPRGRHGRSADPNHTHDLIAHSHVTGEIAGLIDLIDNRIEEKRERKSASTPWWKRKIFWIPAAIIGVAAGGYALSQIDGGSSSGDCPSGNCIARNVR